DDTAADEGRGGVMVDEAGSQTATVSELGSPQQDVRSDGQRNQAVDRVKQYCDPCGKDQPASVAPRRTGAKSAHKGRYKEQEVANHGRRNPGGAGDPRRQFRTQKLACPTPDRIIKTRQEVGRNLELGHYRVDKADAQKYRKDANLRGVEAREYPERNGDRQQDRPYGNPKSIDRAEKQGCQNQHEHRRPELYRSERHSAWPRSTSTLSAGVTLVRATNRYASCVDVGHHICGVGRGRGRIIDQREELIVIDHLGICHIHHVLGSHLETSGEQQARRITQIKVIDRGDAIERETGRIDTKFRQETTILIAVDVNFAGIGLLVVKTTCLAHSLCQGQRFHIERNFRIEAKNVLVQSTQGGE